MMYVAHQTQIAMFSEIRRHSIYRDGVQQCKYGLWSEVSKQKISHYLRGRHDCKRSGAEDKTVQPWLWSDCVSRAHVSMRHNMSKKEKPMNANFVELKEFKRLDNQASSKESVLRNCMLCGLSGTYET
jgi:hypothetical protein